jgi:CubicO group peptidase (beta-lactamase class C family)
MTALENRIEEALRAHAGDTPGLTALVSRDGEVCAVTLGTTDADREPMRRDSLFRIASMTKAVTAAAAMMLVEEGRLALDEPVTRLAPELTDLRVMRSLEGAIEDTVPMERPMTLEDVLTFRLGWGIVFAPPGAYPIQRAIAELGLVGFGMPDPSAPHGPDEWMARLGRLPLMAQPGRRWLYTTGSNLLGVLVARAAGQPLEEVLQARIFAPLGMIDTGFHVPPAKRSRLTTAFAPSKSGLVVHDDPRRSAWNKPPAFPAGDSGLVSTADDFLAFARMLLDGGRCGERQLLSAASVAAMTRDHLSPEQRADGQPILGQGRGWGYGVAVVVEPNPDGVPVGAYGWNGGFGSSWVSDPMRDVAAILLTQRMFDSPDPPEVHKAFWKAALA